MSCLSLLLATKKKKKNQNKAAIVVSDKDWPHPFAVAFQGWRVRAFYLLCHFYIRGLIKL